MKKHQLLNILPRYIFYELVFVASFVVFGFILPVFYIQEGLLQKALVPFALITVSLFWLCFFTTQLRNYKKINFRMFLYLLVSFLFASLVNFQAVLVVAVILSTTFLYECRPFYLRRWRLFFVIKYALDAIAIFTLGNFLLYGYVGSFFIPLFLFFCVVLIFMRRMK